MELLQPATNTVSLDADFALMGIEMISPHNPTRKTKTQERTQDSLDRLGVELGTEVAANEL